MKKVSGTPDGWASVNPVRGPASNGVKPITSDQYPLPATRPRSPITNKGKIKRVFGIEMPRWESELRSCLVGVAAAGEWQQKMRA